MRLRSLGQSSSGLNSPGLRLRPPPCRGLRLPGPPTRFAPGRGEPSGPPGSGGPKPRPHAVPGSAPPSRGRLAPLRARPTHRRRPRSLAPSPSRCRKCRPRGYSAPRGRSRSLAEWPSMVPSPPEKTALRFFLSFCFRLVSLERRRVASQERKTCGCLPLWWRSHQQAGSCSQSFRAFGFNTSPFDPETSLHK